MAKDKEKRKAEAGIGTAACESGAEKAENEKNAAEDENVKNVKANSEADGGGLFLTKEELSKAQEKIAELQKKAEDAVLDAQRIQAEFNNFRKRNSSIRSESMDDGIRETITSLLPVLDNFDRALSNADDTPFFKGMVQIRRQLMDALTKCGLEKVNDEGLFDPELHEAVMRDEEGDAESGEITAVLQTGYSVRGKIIRHTMVKVKV